MPWILAGLLGVLLMLEDVLLDGAADKFGTGEAEGFADLVEAGQELRRNPHVDLFPDEAFCHGDHDGGSIPRLATKVTPGRIVTGESLTLIAFDRHFPLTATTGGNGAVGRWREHSCEGRCAMGSEFTATDTLALEHCYTCGMMYAMPREFMRARQRDGENIHCPAGHKWHYLTEEEQEKRKLEEKESRPAPQASDEYLRVLHRAEQAEARAEEAEAKAKAIAAASAAAAVLPGVEVELPPANEYGHMKCECGKVYSTAVGYLLHRQAKHPAKADAAPQKPAQPEPAPDSPPAGDKIDETKPAISPSGKFHVCRICGKAYKSRGCFDKHVKEHEQETAKA